MKTFIKTLALVTILAAGLSAASTVYSPTSGSTINGTTQQFYWTAAPGGNTYFLNLSRNACYQADLGTYYVSGTSWFESFPQPYTGWFFITLSSQQTPNNWVSSCQQFYVSGPAANVMITSPANGATLTSAYQMFYVSTTNYPYYVTSGTSGVGSSNIGLKVAINSGSFYWPSGLQLWTVAAPIIYIRVSVGSVFHDYQFTLPGQPTNSSAGMTAGPSESGNDDYTGGTSTLPDPNHPAAAIVVKLSGGNRVTIPRADQVRMSNLSWEFGAAGDSTRYTYTLDDREVFLMRIGEDPRWVGSVSLQTSPAGWTNGLNFWSSVAPSPVSRGERQEFSLTSTWRPGVVALFFQSEAAAGFIGNAPIQDNSADNEIIARVGGIFGNSLMRLAIGPVFRPDVPKDEIQRIVKHWVDDLGLESFRPFLETGTLAGITPAPGLEQQAFDCLQAVIQ